MSEKADLVEELPDHLGVTTIQQRLPSDNDESGETETINERKLMWKVDLVLIPWLSLLYLLCFLDRVGIGNARLYGIEADLGMTDSQYLLCLTMFFVPYCLLEAPANVCLRRLKPSIWLSSLIVLWGITTVGQGLVENFAGLLGVRMVLGIFEAGFYPGVMYYLSSWYKRNELGLRFAIFSSSITTAGAFGGLISAAISNMGGVGGKGAWSWIFILEGLVTVVAGVVSFFVIQDFPETARFLSENERKFVIHRLRSDDQFSAGGEALKWKNIRKSVTDYKTWLCGVYMFGAGVPMYSFSLFLPTMVAMLGYTATRANLLTVPVYILASMISISVGYIADRIKRRAFFCMVLLAIATGAYVILLCSRKAALSYFAVYVAAIGIFPSGSNVMAWLSNNIEGAYKRGVSIALVLTLGNSTGMIASNAYRRGDAPWYSTGHAISLGLSVLGNLGAVVLYALLKRENKRRDRGERDEVIVGLKSGDPRNGCYESVEAAKKDKGDEWSGYRYIL